MDKNRRLTNEWKIRKKKSGNISFKESIDLELASSNNNLDHLKMTKSRNIHHNAVSVNVKNLSAKENSLGNCSNFQPRRSKRIQQGLHENTKKPETQGKDLAELQVKSKKKENGKSISYEESKSEKSLNQDYHDLSEWGLPPSILLAYKSRNINTMFQWQYECLSMKNVLEGGNLVFSAPTSAGKTLVAEILMLKKVTEVRKKAIMILPFVSVVREKVHYFQEMFQSAGIVVDGYMGAHNPPGGFKSVDIAICTIEKANNLINRLMEEKRLDELGILVVDELHMIGDHGRGYLLELLLTKLLYNCKRSNSGVQIVGMSATLPNLNVISFWLQSELYCTDFRPVPLSEMFKVGSIVYSAQTKLPTRDLSKSGLSFPEDSDHLVHLGIETVTEGHAVLIFCPSKNWCENLATTIAKAIYVIGNPSNTNNQTAMKQIGEKLRLYLDGSKLSDIILQLKNSPAGLDSVLSRTVPFGVAFHHAGLTFDERDIVEGAFRQGILKILVATTTLSSGVNLPARRVIIRSPLFCGSPIDVLSYKQMVGRAGRKGIDEEGESILLCKEVEKNVALTLVGSELKPVKSCLIKAGNTSLHSSLKRALIEVIASGVASSRKEVLQYISCTLLFATLASEEYLDESPKHALESSIDDCISYLIDNDIIFKHLDVEKDETKEIYKPSRLGLAILASGFSTEDALRVLKELQLARRCFVLENDLHLLYEVTPPYLSDQMGALNWMSFLSLWEQLPEEYKRVGELVGVQESFIGLGVQGRISKNDPKNFHKLAVHQRFWSTLALNDLIQELPLPVVSSKYGCSRGILQSLQQTTSTFAGMLTIFCNRLGWHNLELLFSSFQRRVHFGVQQELCNLVQLSSLNAQRARALYNAGFETVASLASADPQVLTVLLCNMGSFDSAKQLDGELAQEALLRSEAKRIRIIGKQGVNEKEAAVLIIQEAQQFIKQELGLNKISWGSSPMPSTSSELVAENSLTTVDQNENLETIVNTSPIHFQKLDTNKKISTSQSNRKMLLNKSLQADKTDAIVFVETNSTDLSSVNQIMVSSKKTDSKNVTSNLCENETFHDDLSDNFSFFNISVKEMSKRKDDDMISLGEEKDDLGFNELLLSQTANGDNVYFLESFCATNNAKELDVDFNESIIKGRKDSEKLQYSGIELPCHKESDFSFGLSNMNNTKINMGMESIFSELGSKNLSGNLSGSSQALEQIDCIMKTPTVIEEEFVIKNAFVDPQSQNTPQFNTLKKFQAHSTPLRSMLNSFASKTLNDRMENAKFNTPDKKVGVSTNLENKTTNESSIELFECEESLEEKKLDQDYSSSAIEKASKDSITKAETSNELFEDVCFDEVVESTPNCDSNQSHSEKETSRTCKRKCSTSDKCFVNEQNLPCSPSKNSKISEALPSQTEKTSQNMIVFEKNKENITPKCKNLNCVQKNLSPQNLSLFWKSWESSENSLSLSNHKDVETDRNSLKKVKTNSRINKSDSLTLNSADNSIFNSFDSDCLSPTPPKRVGTSGILEITKTPLKNAASPISVIKSMEIPKFSIEDYELSTISNVYSDEVSNELSVNIIDIPDHEIGRFLKCLTQVEKFSLCVSCEKWSETPKTIGPPKSRKNLSPKKNKCLVDPDINVSGLVFCCGKASFYIAIADSEGSCANGSSLEISEKMSLLKQFFKSHSQTAITVYDMKSQYKILWQGCGISLKQKCMDPSIASWLLDPAQGEQPLKMLVCKYLSEASSIIEVLDYHRGSLGLHHFSSISGKLRASTEAFISYHLMNKLIDVLKEQQLYDAFIEIEMPSILALAKMEQNGLGFDASLAVSYQKKLEKKQQGILEDSYQMAGRRFNILSSREVSRILFKELKLSPSVVNGSPLAQKHLSVGASVRSRRLPPELKTNKECLEKIIHLHPLPKAILDWRRLSFATTKVLMPLLRNNKYDNYFCMNRLYSTCYLYTLTGRVNIHSPNLQFVPRDFNVSSIDNEEGCQDSSGEEYHSSEEDILQYGVSLRNLFIPFKGNVLLAADYSQLELRILAHLSKDKNLLNSLNSGDDVFKKIASTWKGIPINSVTDEYRQQAKKICYGMIYGIGPNTLANQLNTTKEDASVFMETFKESYPGLSKYFNSVTQSCLENGYVTTLMNRRRYLPLIKSKRKAEQLQAERQAINTTIQGSAADLLKAAMIHIEQELTKAFPETASPYSIQNLGTQIRQSTPKICRGGFLVLQMHDELIYEVCFKDLTFVMQIVKNAMEKTTKLLVKLPVQIRTGNSWGSLSEYSSF